MSKSLSKESFDRIMTGFVNVFHRHGFKKPPKQVDPRFINVLDELTCLWFDYDLPQIQPDLWTDSEIRLDQGQMDKITLECALILVDQGFESLQYNESLNGLRHQLVGLLRSMGYKRTSGLCLSQRWGCYKLWEELARRSRLSEEKIREDRQWWAEAHPEHFEAA